LRVWPRLECTTHAKRRRIDRELIFNRGAARRGGGGNEASVSGGLEPSTPSLPRNVSGNRWQLVATVSACFGLYRPLRFATDCHRLQPRGSIKAPSAALGVSNRPPPSSSAHDERPTDHDDEPRARASCGAAVVAWTTGSPRSSVASRSWVGAGCRFPSAIASVETALERLRQPVAAPPGSPGTGASDSFLISAGAREISYGLQLEAWPPRNVLAGRDADPPVNH
jgi:hypothetical protein